MKTAEGFNYVLYTESTGEKAKVGDYITMEMVYRNSKDSVLYDSRINKSPIRFRLEKIPFKGSFEDGLTYLAENDSATFFVPADSMYNYMYKKRSGVVIAQKETGLIPGTLLRFDIKLLNIQGDTEAEQEMLIELSEREKTDRKKFEDYIKGHNITVAPDPAGFYLVMKEKGKGLSVDSGRIVTLEYEGRFLNDSVFDGTDLVGRPYKFISGAGHVIPGWELALKNMHVGDKFTLLVPPKLAFGEEGVRDPKSGLYKIPPYTSLVFDISILSVEDAPAVSGK